MSKYLFKNNASATLVAEITSLATTFSVGVGQGAAFPNPTTNESFIVTLQVGANIEIMEVTQRVGDALTVVRAREGTLARVWPINTPVEMRVTAGVMGQFFQLFQEIVAFGKTLALGSTGKITGGTIESSKLNSSQINNPDLRTGSVKAVDGDTTHAIVMPNGGGLPTIGGSEIITTNGSNAFTGPLETSGAVRGVTGTFGALTFKTGTTVYGNVTVGATEALFDFDEDVDIIFKTDGVERFRFDTTDDSFGIGVSSPLQILHTKRTTAVAVYHRRENSVAAFDVGVDAAGKSFIVNSKANAGFSYTENGAEKIGLDTAGRLTVPGGNATGTRFVSTADPSGGADGDIWLKV